MTEAVPHAMALVGDVGGTHARFALVVPGSVQLQSLKVFRCADFPGPGQAIAAYLKHVGPVTVREACVAVAAPVTGDVVTLTSNRWQFDTGHLAQRFGLDRFRLVNDYTAMALGVMHVPASQRVPVGGGGADPSRPVLVLGPGTGLGMSALVPAGDGWIPLATEGGHVDFAPLDDLECEIARRLRAAYGRVSVERLLCGSGIMNLYRTLAEITGSKPVQETPEQVSAAAVAANDELAARALSLFCDILGRVAGNSVLTLGSYGGVYLCGGIVPAILDFFMASGFRAAFENKGRMRPLLEATPVQVVLDGNTGLYGAAAALTNAGR